MLKYLVLLSAVFLAGVAAYFSIFGIASAYVGIPIAAWIMGAAIETGKLFSISYLYRQWNYATRWIRYLMLLLAFILIIVTSSGVYAFLTNGYSANRAEAGNIVEYMEELKQEKTELEERLNLIDEDIARIPGEIVSKRMELIDKYSAEKTGLITRITTIREYLSAERMKKNTVDSHSGLILAVGEQLHIGPDASMKYYTLLIVLSIDPLAILLLLGYNQMVSREQEEKDSKILSDTSQMQSEIEDLKKRDQQNSNITRRLRDAEQRALSFKEQNAALRKRLKDESPLKV